ncbi:DUF1501 domain-containing protein [Roseiconus nitratireducens]|nr:DUF1501 domain-containing protein [Roseiconus nitratireducens]
MSHPSLLDRRDFIKCSVGGSLAMGIGSVVPAALCQAADSVPPAGERILVVVQLTGGNDGLNTVIPYADEAYQRSRPKLRIGSADALRLDDSLALHPSLTGIAELIDDAMASIIQGVGYEHPNRSHFESMDIWHTCRRKTESRTEGWLGRYLETAAGRSGGDVPAMHLGRGQQPFALASRNIPVPTVQRLEEFQLRGDPTGSLSQLLRETSSIDDSADSLLGFVQSNTESALAASDRVRKAARGYRSDIAYPESELAEKLRIVAQLIDSGLTTRVYYVQLDGFDTHAQQRDTHAILLRQWSDAVNAFIRDLQQHDHHDRVCVMTFSEFGRRVAENASEGTDHGAAGPMFLCGGGLKPGLIGGHPSLTDLQDGDLKHHTDFRRVYAAVLRNWLETDPAPIVGEEFEPAEVFA